MKTLIAALTFGSLIAAPASAQSYDPYLATDAYAAVTPLGSPVAPANRRVTADTTREAALRECSVKAQKYTETTWGNLEIHQFRTCMTQHWQPE